MKLALLLLSLCAVPALAQEVGEPLVSTRDIQADRLRPQQGPGQTLPMKSARRLRFDAQRGTWMSLDVSPDGTQVVFDLLGDLYVMPATGGRATAITRGMAFDTQPIFSPDGQSLAFVSDRSGADNLWLSDPRGHHLRQLSFGDDDTVLVSPSWAPDGKSLYVSRYRPDLNNYELRRYALNGVQTLVIPIRDQPQSPRASWRSILGAVASPDGRYVYAAQHVGGLDLDTVGQWSIVRIDLSGGQQRTILTEPDGPRSSLDPGAYFRPALSADGHLLAYGHRVDGATELRVRDLASGVDRRLAFPIERDQLQASMWQDILPRYAFTPDGRAILLSVGGRFERIDLGDGKASPIPFAAPVDLALGPSTRLDIREETGPVRSRLIMAPTPSPNVGEVAFSSFARLYIMGLSEGAKPVELSSAGEHVFQPSWSADGKQMVWADWTERGAGGVWIAPVDGSAPPKRLSDVPTYYSYPVFAPDGRTVLAVRSSQQARLDLYMEYGQLRDAQLVAIPVDGGPTRVITSGRIGGRPQFTTTPGSAYLLTNAGLEQVNLATGKRQLAALVKGPGWYFQDGAVPVDDVRISPDGKWLLAIVSQQLHLLAMPPAGATVDLSDPHLPHRRVTSAGADYFEWSADGKTIIWSTGSRLHTTPLADVVLNPPGRADWSAAPRNRAQRDYPVTVERPRPQPTGALLLRGARVLPMSPGDPILEHADVLVAHGRFAAIGPAGSLTIPAATTVLNMAGKTIVPGFIDTHDHIATVRRDVLGLEDWGLRARLAYGVTTSFDPSTLSIDMLAYQDLLDAGLMVGPRLRQTGIALFSMQRFGSLSDVVAVLRRYRDDYGLRNIKEYRTGNRRVRQWVAEGVREVGLQPTTEGALSMKLDLSQIIDGYAGNEHALVATPLQDDVLRLLAFARTSYTTTLEITNGGPPAEEWSIARDDPHDDSKLRHFWPHVAIDQLMLRGTWRRLGEYRFPSIAADAAALQTRGGLVGIGSHGEVPGLGFHFEMEAHAAGGMSAEAVLHAATIGSAETIGRKSDLGSIEPGKIADLVILDKDPLADIHNARSVRQVMQNGRLYDADTLDQLWPTATTMPPPWFAGDDARSQWLPSGEKK